MGRVNRDVIIAVVLLVVCGIFFWASFDIRVPGFGQLKPSTWPRAILVLLTFLSLIYLIQSLRRGSDGEADGEQTGQGGLAGWLSYWRNPIWCFVLFFAYLSSLPYLGMLIGGISFVFILLGVLGGWERRNILVHAMIAVLSVGGMWSLFTYGLGVILPRGVLFNPFG